MALDTLEVVCRALPPEDVYVVTSDQVVQSVVTQWGAVVVPDPGHGLNGAVQAGTDAAAADIAAACLGPASGRRGGAAGAAPGVPSEVESLAVAVLLGDLPALRAEDLLTALCACAWHDRAVVPDLDGRGTVLLTGTGGALPRPAFGPGSAARHAELATVLPLDLPRLRQDVDDLEALAAAVALGVGPRTAEALSAHRPQSCAAH
jgi:2-phospho-L-lactate guanylyltransferase